MLTCTGNLTLAVVPLLVAAAAVAAGSLTVIGCVVPFECAVALPLGAVVTSGLFYVTFEVTEISWLGGGEGVYQPLRTPWRN